MKRVLREIAEINLGYQPKGRIRPDKDSPYRIIQIKDFDDDRNLDESSLTRFKPDRDPTPYLLQPGDVLFLARGHVNWSLDIDFNINNLVVVSYFFVLRPKDEGLDSSYLAWYLNQAPAQGYLTQMARRGTHMPVVPKSALKDLPVELPSLETQRKVAALYRLARQERRLVCRIGEQRETLMRAISMKAINNDQE